MAFTDDMGMVNISIVHSAMNTVFLPLFYFYCLWISGSLVIMFLWETANHVDQSPCNGNGRVVLFSLYFCCCLFCCLFWQGKYLYPLVLAFPLSKQGKKCWLNKRSTLFKLWQSDQYECTSLLGMGRTDAAELRWKYFEFCYIFASLKVKVTWLIQC